MKFAVSLAMLLLAALPAAAADKQQIVGEATEPQYHNVTCDGTYNGLARNCLAIDKQRQHRIVR